MIQIVIMCATYVAVASGGVYAVLALPGATGTLAAVAWWAVCSVLCGYLMLEQSDG